MAAVPRLTVLTLALLATGCASLEGGSPARTVALESRSGSSVTGTLRLRDSAAGLRIQGEVRGLQPNAEHGFHIHEKGDCGNNGNASGGHFNPAGGMHGKFGGAGTHAGELPSLVADAAGVARFSVDVHTISLTDGAANNVVGRALVVHRDPDDFSTQPAGNSGPRIACAVITRG